MFFRSTVLALKLVALLIGGGFFGIDAEIKLVVLSALSQDLTEVLVLQDQQEAIALGNYLVVYLPV